MSRLITLLNTVLVKTRFLLFSLVGASGVALNLLTTFLLTEFVFGKNNYFIAYLIGSALNLTYNFALHSLITFKTKHNHTKRFLSYAVFSIISGLIQIFTVRYVVSALGNAWYLLVISATIFTLSTLSFIFFKYMLFNESLAKDKEVLS
jgi:putative flippase GtrA